VYLVSRIFWDSWAIYVEYENDEDEIADHPEPGPIDNTTLLEPKSATIKEHITTSEYKVIEKASWDLLVSWYTGGPELPRKVVKTVQVELWPLRLHIFKSSDPKKIITITVSDDDTIRDFRDRALPLLGITKNCVLWDFKDTGEKYQKLQNLEKRISYFNILNGDKILFEEIEENEETEEVSSNNSEGEFSENFRVLMVKKILC
jgi:hypothetical protein